MELHHGIHFWGLSEHRLINAPGVDVENSLVKETDTRCLSSSDSEQEVRIMVMLKRAVEEMARVERNPAAVWPAWQADESIREMLDGELRLKLIEWGVDEGKKALIIGGCWPRLATDLANAGMFVTVIEPDADRAREITEVVAQAEQLSRVNVHTDDYKNRTFESAGFHLVVAWDALQQYTELGPMLRKIHREMKTGGRLFVRVPVERENTRTDTEVLRRRIRLALSMLHGSKVSASDAWLLPSTGALRRDELKQELEALLVVEDFIQHHALLPDWADLAGGGVAFANTFYTQACALEQRLLQRKPAAARFVAAFARKERELGRVFKM